MSESRREAGAVDRGIYDPVYVANLFDRCSSNYRRWSAVSSFGFTFLWRRQCVARLDSPAKQGGVAVDLMAGTGEVWPHLLRQFPNLSTITAIDISHRMHLEAVDRLHGSRADQITHIEDDVLEADLPGDYADLVVSTFGPKTFSENQQTVLAQRIAKVLKPGGTFSLIEASDPKGWMLRPVYRFYLDRALPQIERFFLKGANDFSMIGTYTRNFGSCAHMVKALRDAGLDVSEKRHFFGCATSVAGSKPRMPDS